jgi:hypothetical protein
MASFLPSFSNIVHKLQVEVALFNQLKGGLKEANRHRVSVVTTTSATPTASFVFIAPWAGSVESVIVASATPTTSTSGNSVTFEVIDVTQSNAILLNGDTFVSKTELVANTGVAFYNPGPSISNGSVAYQFNAGDLIEVKGVVNGTPSGYTPGVTNLVVTMTPADPKVAF